MSLFSEGSETEFVIVLFKLFDMPIKIRKSRIVDSVSDSLLNVFELRSCTLTMSDKDIFKLVSGKYVLNEPISEMKYGTGVLAYTGQGLDNGSMFVGQATSRSNSTLYLIRAETNQYCVKLNSVVRAETAKLAAIRMSVSEGLGGIRIPDNVNPDVLLQKAINKQSQLKSKRLKVSLTSQGFFEIGSPSSTKFIQVALVHQASDPNKQCLCIVSRVRESSPKFMGMLDNRNLGLEDIHALSIRDSFEALIDCELKKLVLDYVKCMFQVPTKEALKPKKIIQSPKVRYIQSAFASSLEYLNNPALKEDIQTSINAYLDQLATNSEFKDKFASRGGSTSS